jgi:bacillithiol biosynthesis deacetylase BshB1
MDYHVDVLAFGAHPDDVELAAGGTVAKLAEDGRTVAVVDFTRGEMGTRGTPEIRLQESEAAARIMNVKFRENLGLPDCNLKLTDEAAYKTIQMIRKYRPAIVLMNSEFERHPDHEAVHAIVRNAMFTSGLRKYVTELDGEQQKVHRIRKMFSYQQSYEFRHGNIFYVDISSTFQKKMDSIKAYASQVWVPGISSPDGPVTRLSRPEFLEEIEARCISNGIKIGCRYAEAFSSVEPLGIENLSKFL